MGRHHPEPCSSTCGVQFFGFSVVTRRFVIPWSCRLADGMPVEWTIVRAPGGYFAQPSPSGKHSNPRSWRGLWKACGNPRPQVCGKAMETLDLGLRPGRHGEYMRHTNSITTVTNNHWLAS